MQNLKFTELSLSPEILKAVDKMGFEEASPIQTAAIPPILAGQDIVGISSTGSGKTAAFAIPMVEKVDPKLRKVQVLVLCPTRELAVQVAEEVAKLSLFKRNVHAVPIFGGQSYERQFRALESGVQIVIGTPGRVIDHIERGTLKLDALKMLVLDEADRMLDMGFRDDIEQVLSKAPKDHQTLLFSATMPRPIEELIRRYANNPKRINIEPVAKNAPQVEQLYLEVERRSKIEILTRLIDINDFTYGIIFCATKNMVDDLNDHLKVRGYATERLHGDITQAQRSRTMEKFRRRNFDFLVATDVAARGLDVDDLEVVFNFDLPNDAEDYTHRIGRTGRAGKSGKAYTLVSGRELYALQNMIRYGKLKIRRENVPSLDLVEEARENQFFEKLRQTLDGASYKKQDRLIDRFLEQGYPSTDIISALLHIIQQSNNNSDQGRAVSPYRATATVGQPPFAQNAFATPKSSPHQPRSTNRDSANVEANAPTRFSKPFKKEKFPTPADTPTDTSTSTDEFPPARQPRPKQKYAKPARTGHEAGYSTLFVNVGRKHLVTPADIVGKIAGLTKLPPTIVGAIDIHQRYTLVDVIDDHVATIIAKLTDIPFKNIPLKLAPAIPNQLPKD